MKIEDFDFAICTVSREGQYIHSTLESLCPHYPVSLVVGSRESEYLERYRDCAGLNIIEPTPEAWAEIQEAPIHQRASWNYWRCLTETTDRGRGLIVFEDDVRFAQGWEQRLLQTVEALEAEYGQNYLLSLYACFPFVLEGYLRGDLYAEYAVEGFYGLQGMLYPPKVRADFAAYLKQHGVDNYRIPDDLLLKEYLFKQHIPLFATTPSLIQHIGKQTTGLGHHHQTGGFVEVMEVIGRAHAMRAEALSAENACAVSEKFIKHIPPYPDTFSGRGIVICAGGQKYFTSAWVCINLLRHLGCTLPIQIWYLGRKEMSEQMKALVKPLGVECIDAKSKSSIFIKA